MHATVRSGPAVFGYGAALGIVLGAFNYTGGALTGYVRDPGVDEVERKEYMRKNRRRPLEDTVTELGEGRGMKQEAHRMFLCMLTLVSGIYAPGYAERRAQRLKENYGIEVPTTPIPASP